MKNSLKERESQARSMYARGLNNVKNNIEPKGQKFHIGERVKIADDLGSSMRFFPKGVRATVLYTYAYAYGGKNIKDYCLNVDGYGEISWYAEHQLSLVK